MHTILLDYSYLYLVVVTDTPDTCSAHSVRKHGGKDSQIIKCPLVKYRLVEVRDFKVYSDFQLLW